MADISDTEPNIENSDSEDDEFIPKSSNKTINLNIDDSDKEDDDDIDDDNDDNDDISIAESEDSLVSNEEDDLGIEQINVQSSNLNMKTMIRLMMKMMKMMITTKNICKNLVKT